MQYTKTHLISQTTRLHCSGAGGFRSPTRGSWSQHNTNTLSKYYIGDCKRIKLLTVTHINFLSVENSRLLLVLPISWYFLSSRKNSTESAILSLLGVATSFQLSFWCFHLTNFSQICVICIVLWSWTQGGFRGLLALEHWRCVVELSVFWCVAFCKFNYQQRVFLQFVYEGITPSL